MTGPHFIFFINESQDTATHFCFYNTIQIAKYNAKHFTENIVFLDYKSAPKEYEFNTIRGTGRFPPSPPPSSNEWFGSNKSVI